MWEGGPKFNVAALPLNVQCLYGKWSFSAVVVRGGVQ